MPEQPRSTRNLDPIVTTTFQRLRRRIRRFLWTHASATAIGLLGVWFWLSLSADWFFEPTRPFRLVGLIGIIGLGLVGLGYVVRQIVSLTGARLGDTQLATLLERRFPQLDDSLLTTVAETPELPGTSHDLFRTQTGNEATARLASIDLRQLFDYAPLRRTIGLAAISIVSVGLFGFLFPEATGLWARRTLLLADENWPQQTRLELVGFDETQKTKVARGADYTLHVRADASMPVIPSTVTVRYQTESGATGRVTMNRVGNAAATGEPFQRYEYPFQAVLASLTLDVLGGDDRIDDVRLQVVESPTIEQLTLECAYPDYMERASQTIPVGGPISLPEGTTVTIVGRANKPLQKVRITDRSASETDNTNPATEPDSTDTNSPDPSQPVVLTIDGTNEFRWESGRLDRDRTVRFELVDTEEIESRQPISFLLTAIPDRPPEPMVELDGISTAITPGARIPLAGRLLDDHGLARSWFEFSIDDEAVQNEPPTDYQGNPTEIPLRAAAFDLDRRGFEAGQTLHLRLKAADRCLRDDQPQTGAGRRWSLEIVTPDRLRTLLQARELVLRRRFEAIYDEVDQTRDILVDFAWPEEKSPHASDSDRPPSNHASNHASLARQLHAERALRNGRKNRSETRGVAEAFADIDAQLTNNRIHTNELKERLADGILGPLRRLVENDFPELERRLTSLRETIDEPKTAPIKRDEARAAIDQILVRMKQTLGRMMQLEDFNEIIAQLESILKAEERLQKNTEKEHNAELEDLLE